MGRDKLLLSLIVFSPHLASPEGEGQLLSLLINNVVIRQLQMIIRQYSTANGICPSPSGEARWGLKSVSRVTSSFSWGRLGWVWGQVGAEVYVRSHNYYSFPWFRIMNREQFLCAAGFILVYRLYALACSWNCRITSIGKHIKTSRNGQAPCPSGASTLPQVRKHRAPSGQAQCPKLCPKFL